MIANEKKKLQNQGSCYQKLVKHLIMVENGDFLRFIQI